MNTAEQLEKMTDRGKFERLANAVLSKADTNYRAIIAFGINTQGETIRGSLDAFCLVPDSNPPHFISVQHTTTDAARLRGKWLSENSKAPGDLTKIGEKINKLKIDFPDACFTAVLSTNQCLPDDDLVVDVRKKADEFGITSIDIWELSKYARFLDHDRDGQYLRKTFLGTDAEMLSLELLSEIGKKSLRSYRQFSSPKIWTSREIDNPLNAQLNESVGKILFLKGESGFGKSVAAYRLLKDHLDSGGLGIHIPESVIQGSISLDDALRETLQRLCPTLLSNEVSQIPEYASRLGSGFVIVIDDINQTSNPTRIIRNLVSWVTSPFVIVCPIWPRFWTQVRDLEPKLQVELFTIDRMSMKEACMAVQAVAKASEQTMSNIEIRDVAYALSGDPLLIGMFGDFPEKYGDTSFINSAQSIITLSIERRLGEVSSANTSNLQHEYHESLRKLTSFMLNHRKLYPQWSDIEFWFQGFPRELEMLRQLCKHAGLCCVDNGDFHFRHDRFLECFCVEAIGQFFSAPEEYSDVLFEPYYAEIIGQALVRFPQDDYVLDLICKELPLALVSALRYIGTLTGSYYDQIISRTTNWIRAHAGSRNTSTPESIRGAVALSLLRTDLPAVSEMANTSFGLEKPWLGGFARLRNGDPKGVLDYCATNYGSEIMDISTDTTFFLELINHARLRHREQLTCGLTQVFESMSVDNDKRHLKGAVILTGFLGLSELQASIQGWWNGVTDKTEALSYALWAALRCTPSVNHDEFLDSLIAYWAELPDVEEGKRAGKRESIGNRLTMLFSRFADQDAVHYLVLQVSIHPILQSTIAHICGRIDIPDAVEFAATVCANVTERVRDRSCSITSWGSSHYPRLSALSVARLENIWKSPEKAASIRQLAFKIWEMNNCFSEDNLIQELSTVTPEESFFKDSTYRRALLGDKTCIPSLLSILYSDTSFFRVVQRVWCDEIASIADAWLKSRSFQNIPRDYSGGRLNEHYDLAYLFTMIPAQDAERLLCENWAHLHYSRLFVQAALYIGTPRCLSMAESAIREYPENINPFEHIDQAFGFWGYGHGLFPETRQPPVELWRLKNLQSYLERLDDLAISSIAEICYYLGPESIEWCRAYLPESVNSACRRRYIPTEDDLIRDIDGWSRQRNGCQTWLEAFEKRGDSRNPIDILEKWLQLNPNINKYKVVAECLETIGTREDLKILDITLQHPAERSMASSIRESAVFAVRRRSLE